LRKIEIELAPHAERISLEEIEVRLSDGTKLMGCRGAPPAKKADGSN
jgi:hypothetical protein